jgi:hypothetical protein
MLLSLCSYKPEAFGLAIGVEKVQIRVLVSPGDTVRCCRVCVDMCEHEPHA